MNATNRITAVVTKVIPPPNAVITITSMNIITSITTIIITPMATMNITTNLHPKSR